MATTTLMTAEELACLPETAERIELVRGEVRRMPPANPEHGRRAATATIVIGSFVRQHGLGEVYTADPGFILGRVPDTVRAPDLAFIRRERIPPVGERERGYWELAPDLVVEVVSPSESADDLQEKVTDYLSAGTRLVWALFARTRTASVYRPDGTVRLLHENDPLDGEDVLPGFSCRVAELL